MPEPLIQEQTPGVYQFGAETQPVPSDNTSNFSYTNIGLGVSITQDYVAFGVHTDDFTSPVYDYGTNPDGTPTTVTLNPDGTLPGPMPNFNNTTGFQVKKIDIEANLPLIGKFEISNTVALRKGVTEALEKANTKAIAWKMSLKT